MDKSMENYRDISLPPSSFSFPVIAPVALSLYDATRFLSIGKEIFIRGLGRFILQNSIVNVSYYSSMIKTFKLYQDVSCHATASSV